MLILITYDVNTENEGGKARLRKVAKECEKYGQRVQNSVFECKLDITQYEKIKDKLGQIINKKLDSVRFYNLGNNSKTRVETLGLNKSYDAEGILMI